MPAALNSPEAGASVPAVLYFTETPATSGWSDIPPPRRARAGTFGGEALSFAPAPDAHFAGVWSHWAVETFGPHLLEVMLHAMNATRADHTRDVLACDAHLAGVFAPDVVLRLRRAGHAMLGRMDGMRGSRSALKFRAAAVRGETPGLFPVVFALQSAVYNVPARASLLAYARLEWRAARETQGGPWDHPGENDTNLILSRIEARFHPTIVPAAVAAVR